MSHRIRSGSASEAKETWSGSRGSAWPVFMAKMELWGPSLDEEICKQQVFRLPTPRLREKGGTPFLDEVKSQAAENQTPGKGA